MKIVVCVDINEKGINGLDVVAQFWRKHSFPGTEVHLVHVFETRVYAVDLYAAVYPTPEQYPEIDEAVKRIMRTKAIELVKNVPAPDDLRYVVLHAADTREALVEYLKETKAELVVVPTRGLTGVKGMFSSSFADFMTHHSPCPVLVAR